MANDQQADKNQAPRRGGSNESAKFIRQSALRGHLAAAFVIPEKTCELCGVVFRGASKRCSTCPKGEHDPAKLAAMTAASSGGCVDCGDLLWPGHKGSRCDPCQAEKDAKDRGNAPLNKAKKA